MKNGKVWLIAVLALVAVLVISGISSYNGLVAKKESVDSKLASISVQLERRADLIPNLVNTVKGYATHETEIIESVTKARENLVNAKSVDEKSTANKELTTALNNLLVIVENYPDLKSNQNFIQLQDELAGTENRIAVARNDYNTSVETYNTSIKKFPNSIFAGIFGFEKVAYFEVEDSKKDVPNVSF